MSLPLVMLALAEALTTASTTTIPMCVNKKNARFISPNILQIQRAANTGGGTVWSAKLLGLSNASRQDFLGDGVATVYQSQLPFVALANYNWIVKTDKSTRTGTATVVAGSTGVTGAGTQFLTELKLGAEITINGERKVIASITSATVMTVDSAFNAAAAGASVFLNDDIMVATTDYTVSNVGGFAAFTFSAAAKAPLNARIEVHFVVPTALYTFATATTIFAQREIPGGEVFWYVSDATATPSSTNIYIFDGIGE